MFGLILLDAKLAISAVLIAAFLEAAGIFLLGKKYLGVVPAAGRPRFIRQRLSLAVVFITGVIVYHYLKNAYLYDPFFHALYTFLVAFALFYYFTGLAALVTALITGRSSLTESDQAPYWMTALVLLGVLIAKPQASTFGFFAGAGVHLVNRLVAKEQKGKLFHLWLVIGLGIFFLVALTILSHRP